MKTSIMAFLVLFLVPIFSYAETCHTIDTSDWTTEEKNMLHAASYRLLWEADGEAKVTSINKHKGEMCFDDPKSDLKTVLSQAKVESKVSEILEDSKVTPEKLKQFEISRIDSGDVTAGEVLKAIAAIAEESLTHKALTEEALKEKIKEQSGLK